MKKLKDIFLEILRWRWKSFSRDYWFVGINQELESCEKSHHPSGNFIVTSKYTMWNFLFKNLYEQFHKASNIYFLFVMILQSIPATSSTGGYPSLLLPLSIVLIAYGGKEAYEDIQRHRSDDLENGQTTYRVMPPSRQPFSERSMSLLTLSEDVNPLNFNSGGGLTENVMDVPTPLENNEVTINLDNNVEYEDDGSETSKSTFDEHLETFLGMEKIKWKQVEIGNIIFCEANQSFPADLVFLSSSSSEDIAFVETSSLDGETNLKIKQVIPNFSKLINNDEFITQSISSLKAKIKSMLPSSDLSTFSGSLKTNEVRGEKKVVEIPISIENMLLRGCKLRNTEWIIGAVVYAGHDTKILMNSTSAPYKTSHIEMLTNKLVFAVGGIQACLCLAVAIVSAVLSTQNLQVDRPYLGFFGSTYSSIITYVIVQFLKWIALTSNFIPISLVVVMGMVKVIQAYFITIDNDMYNQEQDNFPAARTSDLNEELGLVNYVCSDKTGTLTCNEMVFRTCCIHGKQYGAIDNECKRKSLEKQGIVLEPHFLEELNAKQTPFVNFSNTEILHKLQFGSEHERQEIIDFFLHLSVNNSIIVTRDSDNNLSYSASSPDEGALVYAAKHVGAVLLERNQSGCVVELFGKKIAVEILASFDFTSARKRSSVICRISYEGEDDKIVLFCKGADSVIEPLLKSNSDVKNQVFKAMEEYAVDGLRTLCIAKKEISAEELAEWLPNYEKANLDIHNRVALVEAEAEKIENGLVMQGATGIEDRLQDGVEDAIESMRLAGIRVWMLTGDKYETAINIGISTGLLTEECERIEILWGNCNKDKEILQQKLNTFQKLLTTESESMGERKILLIDGETILQLDSINLIRPFKLICSYCDTAICCRTAPAQKGFIVELLRGQGKVILAIGDGANDCTMIQKADIGIGLRGKEGLQAFNTSDYGISKFAHIKQLLLVHGRLSYRRISLTVLYMMYKNIVLVLPIFYYAVISLCSGQKIYFEFMYQLYNVVFTSIPIIIVGVFDLDVDKNAGLKYPELYHYGHLSHYFNFTRCLKWFITAIWHSVVVYFVPYYCLAFDKIASGDGMPLGLWFIGNIQFLSVVVIVNFKLLLESPDGHNFLYLAVFLSILSVITFNYAFSFFLVLGSSLAGFIIFSFKSFTSWITIAITIFLSLFLDYLLHFYEHVINPQKYHLLSQQAQSLRSSACEQTDICQKLCFTPVVLAKKYKDVGKGIFKNVRESRFSRRLPFYGFAFSEADPIVAFALPKKAALDNL